MKAAEASSGSPRLLQHRRLGRLRLVYGLDAIESLAEIAFRDLNVIVVLQIEQKCAATFSVIEADAGLRRAKSQLERAKVDIELRNLPRVIRFTLDLCASRQSGLAAAWYWT